MLATSPLMADKKPAAYKPCYENARKPGLLLWNGADGDILYWSDLVRVRYRAKAVDEAEPVEEVTLEFHQHILTVFGHRLTELFVDCQRHIPDTLRVSSKEELLRDTGKEALISRLKIEPVKKGK